MRDHLDDISLQNSELGSRDLFIFSYSKFEDFMVVSVKGIISSKDTLLPSSGLSFDT